VNENLNNVSNKQPPNISVEFGAMSHPGLVRTKSEDHYIVCRMSRSLTTLLANLSMDSNPSGESVYGMVIADGLGGLIAGDIASSEAIKALFKLVQETPDWIMRLNDDMAYVVLHRIKDRFRKVREKLIEKVKDRPSLSGMATTLTIAASHGTDLFIGHLGDSRAYLLSQNHLYLVLDRCS
jgi:PPM family protein phosphatase